MKLWNIRLGQWMMKRKRAGSSSWLNTGRWRMMRSLAWQACGPDGWLKDDKTTDGKRRAQRRHCFGTKEKLTLRWCLYVWVNFTTGKTTVTLSSAPSPRFCGNGMLLLILTARWHSQDVKSQATWLKWVYFHYFALPLIRKLKQNSRKVVAQAVAAENW